LAAASDVPRILALLALPGGGAMISGQVPLREPARTIELTRGL